MRLLSALLTLMLLASPAAAGPCLLCGPQEAGAKEAGRPPVALEVETSLDFDRVLLVEGSGGTARIGADGSRSTSGAVAGLSGRAMAGTVTIQGEPNRSLRIDLPDRIDLHGWNGARLTVTRVTTDLPPSPRLDASGRLTFHFGGEVVVGADAEGEYRGDVPVTVDYF